MFRAKEEPNGKLMFFGRTVLQYAIDVVPYVQ